MNVLLTGGAGFLGGWIARGLRARGHDVVAPDAWLFDAGAARAVVEARPWDAVVHLAAVSTVQACEADPELAYRTNLGLTALLVDLLARARPGCRFVFPSTAHVYAPPSAAEAATGLVIGEDRPVGPVTTYGRSKWLAELVVRDATDRGLLRGTVLRLFNHSHHTQAAAAFLPHVEQSLRAGLTEVPVGNLDVRRDFGAMRDLVAAFTAVIEHDDAPAGPFNVCSGHAAPLRSLVTELAARLGVRATFVTDPARVRADEPPVLVGDWRRLHAATGFVPTVGSVADVIDAFLSDPE